jgi:hypothetical protein
LIKLKFLVLVSDVVEKHVLIAEVFLFDIVGLPLGFLVLLVQLKNNLLVFVYLLLKGDVILLHFIHLLFLPLFICNQLLLFCSLLFHLLLELLVLLCLCRLGI